MQLRRSILVKEFIQGEEAAANSNFDLVFHTLYHDSLSTELIDSLRFTHEHNFEFLAVWVVVDVLGQLFVNRVVLDWDVDCDAGFQVNDVLAQLLNFLIRLVKFCLVLLHLLEHLELSCLRLVIFLLKLVDVGRGALKLDL